MKKFTTILLGMALGASAYAATPVPANPKVESYMRRGFMYELKVTIPSYDVDGNALDTDKLSYRFYSDGEAYVFSKSDYWQIESEMTEIPWGYQDANGNGYDIVNWDGADLRRIYIYNNPNELLSVESVYRDENGEAVSQKYNFNVNTNEGYVGDEKEGDAVGDPNLPIITDLPDTAIEELYTLDTWIMSGILMQHYTWSGKFDYLAFDDDVVYFKNICSEYVFDTYVKGDIINNGTTIRIPMGQHVFHQNADSYGTERADVYLQAIKVNSTDTDLELEPEKEYVDFTIDENGVISLPYGYGIAYVGHDGYLLAKNIGYKFQPFDMEKATVVPPQNAEVLNYAVSYASETGGDRTKKAGIKVIFDGNDVYVQGLAKTMSEGWIKGNLTDNKVIFPSVQYVGTYVNDYGTGSFAVYFNGAYDTGEMGLFGTIYETQDNITFTYNPTTGTLTSEDCATETIGSVNPLTHIVAPELTRVEEIVYGPAIPATPKIVNWASRGFMYELKVDVPSIDVEGNPLDVENLVYRFYVNGQPFEFKKSEYNYIEENMFDIPWGYQDANGIGYDIINENGEDRRKIYFYFKPTEIAVESEYTINGVSNKSNKYVYNVQTGQGYEEVNDTPSIIENFEGKEINNVEFIDLTGKCVSNPQRNGIYVKVTHYTDGSVKSEKVIF